MEQQYGLGCFAVDGGGGGWADGAGVTVNGQAVGVAAEPGTYACVRRTWATGDTIELDLPMPARLMQAHPRVEQCRGQVAVFRGPILYCLESVDLPEDMSLWDIHVPSDVGFEPVAAGDLPFGVRVLEGDALHRRENEWSDVELYRPVQAVPLNSVRLRLIPYFAWANRGPSAMSVWLPVMLRG